MGARRRGGLPERHGLALDDVRRRHAARADLPLQNHEGVVGGPQNAQLVPVDRDDECAFIPKFSPSVA
jgi:hypothetical protein